MILAITELRDWTVSRRKWLQHRIHHSEDKRPASKEKQAIHIYDNDGKTPIFSTTSNKDLSWDSWLNPLDVGEHKFKAKLQGDEEVSNEWVITVLSSNTH